MNDLIETVKAALVADGYRVLPTPSANALEVQKISPANDGKKFLIVCSEAK